jgi:hypothetical protein
MRREARRNYADSAAVVKVRQLKQNVLPAGTGSLRLSVTGRDGELAERETQPHRVVVRFLSNLDCPELLEDLFSRFRRDPVSLVVHGDSHAAPAAGDGNAHRAAGGGVPDAVVDEVLHDSPDECAVAAHFDGAHAFDVNGSLGTNGRHR